MRREVHWTTFLNFSQKNYQTNYFPYVEAYVYIDDVSECDAYVGFYKDADEYAYFHIDNGDIYLKSDDGGGEGPYSEDSGINLTDGTWVLLRVVLDNTETAEFWINGTEYGTPTAGAVTADNMTPYYHIVNTTDNTCKLFIDYTKIFQNRDT